MSRRIQSVWAVCTSLLIVLTGCHPTQPYYLFEKGDLAHYVDKATQIEYPDAQTSTLADVANVAQPLTIENAQPKSFWDIKLEDCVKIAMDNSKVMRSLGGRYASSAFQSRAQTGEAPDALTTSIDNSRSVYDPALAETLPFGGTEYALSAFDAQLSSSIFWQHNDRPQNVRAGQFGGFFTPNFEENNSTFQAQLAKTNATGGTWFMRQNTFYDQTNNPTWQVPSTYNVNFETAFSQPLLQGAGLMYNRIAGPYNPFATTVSQTNTPAFDGVLLARINVDISLADFEAGIRNLVFDVENAYWELYFAYRALEASKTGRASALQTWQKIHALYVVGARGGEAEKEAQSRAQYFLFRAQVQTSLNDLFRAENRLRYVIGLAMADGRLIRPADEPTTAEVSFDWCDIHSEALARSVDLRRQKWRIKERELEIIAAKNLLQPRLDASGTYRWLGLGDKLIDSDRKALPINPALPLQGTNAFQNLTSGHFQEWQLGLQFQLPIGFRSALSTVRHYQLQLAKEHARLQDQELEVSHQVGESIRNIDYNYNLSQSNFNRRVAAEKQVEAVKAAFEAETVTLDLLLDAQRQRADAEIAYFRALVDYQRGIAQVHFRKGSLLEYDGVYLAEGPWPAKAQFDAHRLARQRDASHYLDYGFTRPKVMSRGSYLQFGEEGHPGEQGAAAKSDDGQAAEGEKVPTPAPALNSAAAEADANRGPAVARKAAQAGSAWAGFNLQGGGANPPLVAAGGKASQDKPAGNQLKVVAQAAAADKPSADGVRQAVYEQWKSNANHESDEDQPARTDDRPAAGWQRKKR